jgi:lipoyl(octanoyl) transferase
MNYNVAILDKIDYGEALEIQEKLYKLRLDDKIPDTLILQEHFPVITLGVRGKYENILLSKKMLEEKKIKIFEIKRGGDVTYHGPGQMVGYIIFDLKNYGRNIKDLVWNLEESFIKFLKEKYNIESYRDDKKYTGVWVKNNKITAFGISVRHWITMHGFAFNINTNLDDYQLINPCGINDRGVTSLEKLTGIKQDFNNVLREYIYYFSTIFNLKPEILNKLDLEKIISSL